MEGIREWARKNPERLQEMLNSLADFYDEEIETNLGRFITLVEPILLVIMELVIAGLLLALYMPLFNISARSRFASAQVTSSPSRTSASVRSYHAIARPRGSGKAMRAGSTPVSLQKR